MRLVEVHHVEQLVGEHELEPLAVLQQLTFVRGREEDGGIVERQGRGHAVREVRRIEEHEVDQRFGAPGEERAVAREERFGDAGHDAGLRAMLLRKMDQEACRLQRAPAIRRIDKGELAPLRGARGSPEQQRYEEPRSPAMT